jgi:hypothetical protein
MFLANIVPAISKEQNKVSKCDIISPNPHNGELNNRISYQLSRNFGEEERRKNDTFPKTSLRLVVDGVYV